MNNLYSKFIKTKNIVLSYNVIMFCCLQPFWVVASNIHQRETCLCISYANIDLIMTSLKLVNTDFSNYQ